MAEIINLHAYDTRREMPEHTSERTSPGIGKANFYTDAGWSIRKCLAIFGCGGIAGIILTFWIAGYLVQSGLLK